VRLKYTTSLEMSLEREACDEWLNSIKTKFGNFVKKEDEVLTTAFGAQGKQRLNCVFDNFRFFLPRLTPIA
jgi:hypothetical protein